MTKPYQNISAKTTRFTSNLPFSTGGFCITSDSAFSQANPRACEGKEREGRVFVTDVSNGNFFTIERVGIHIVFGRLKGLGYTREEDRHGRWDLPAAWK